MSISETQQITEVSNQIDANKHIDAGWILLGVAGGVDIDNIPVFIYSLGWTSDEKPPHIN